MSIERIIAEARQKIGYRVPRYIDINVVIDRARQDLKDMALEQVQSAMEQAILGAQSILKSTCQEYIEALYVTEDYKIAIKPEAAHLEEGYDGYEMKENILSGPKAQTSKDGNRYAVVPIGDKPRSDIHAAISKKTSELLSSNRDASPRGLSQMVEDMRNLVRRSPQSSFNPGPKEFRTASDKQEGGWVHPGFQGVNQLEFINENLRVALVDGAVRILENEISRMRR